MIEDEEEAGTKEEQAEFMRDLEAFYKERFMDFKPPKFYGEPLNCLKYAPVPLLCLSLAAIDLPLVAPILSNGEVLVFVLSRLWRAVIQLGGYDRV